MPIYEYDCPKCGEFEVTQRITEEPLKRCPTCRSKVRKLISNTSFQLKGSGWYLTDYARKDNGAKKEAAEGKGESTTGATAEAKSDAKSDAKSETASSTKGKKAKGESAQAA
jgi:putative FmdB family regulatory protein